MSFLPNKLSQKVTNKIDKYLVNKLGERNRKQRSLYMLKKIGYDIEPAINNNVKFIMLIKAYQMHYRQSLVSGKLDFETFQLIQSHFNEILT